ncbi:M16 family metallopeptidase [Clostridium celatum]|uniref:M16 family metallopeptidase n=1 Tax=Clostridium celatum TaxID=36834 RepID=UPI001899CEF8|nr:pitrilysin family protein [Clostridium celatum]MDY3360164.1 pitrilysin family protein [Clostridium celatum]
MKDYILDNGLKLIYKKSNSELSSIAISLDAGAARDGENLGVAHVTEHMVYKGTETRSEKKINEELSNIFGFQNAMTNYPYVVFYGTLLSEDLQKGLELFSDILLAPVFTEEGFKEEMEVIKQELKEWDEELEQYTEDKLYLNCMECRRIKYPIIGTEKSLNNITIDDAIDFFNDYYCANNATITIISQLEFEEVRDLVEEYFIDWRSERLPEKDEIIINPKNGVFIDKKEEINTAKVQVIFPINKLNQWEIKALKVFNQYFGEGVNSVLFDTLRTKYGLVYDVLTRVANEEHIKVYKITYSTAHENVDKSIEIVKELVQNVDCFREKLQKKDIEALIKSFRLKRLFADEQSVRLAMQLATYDTMFGDGLLYIDETENLNKMPVDFIINTANKVFENMSIQVITNF